MIYKLCYLPLPKEDENFFSRDFETKYVRKKGGDRESIKKKPEIIERIEALMKYETAGDPIVGLNWTRRTTEKIATDHKKFDMQVCANTVGKLLKNIGFSLKVNHKKYCFRW
jgi:hypothetical protein